MDRHTIILTMAKEESSKNLKQKGMSKMGDTVYGMGVIGALFYFISNAQTFTDGLIGVLKAIVWPAFIVFKLLEFLKI